MKTVSVLACLAGLVLGTLPAVQAATVTYAFSVTGNAGSGSGTFQFDTAPPPGGVGLFEETEYALTSFSFVFGNTTFDLDDLDGKAGRALFDGAKFLGLEAARTAPLSFSLLPSVGGEDPFFATHLANSSITFRLAPNGVPEPGTVGLGLAALGALAALRRRRPS